MPDSDRDSKLYRAESWIRRAASLRSSDDLDGRFIFYWIGFNALYGQAKYLAEDRKGEEESIHEFLGTMVRLGGERPWLRRMLNRVQTEIVDLLKNQFLFKEYWADGFTNHLDDRLHSAEHDLKAALAGEVSMARLLIQAFDCLYVLRIQVFHGCAKDTSSANRASLEPAVAVMKRFVPLFWAMMKRVGAEEDWGPVSYPAWGREGHPPENRTRCFTIRH